MSKALLQWATSIGTGLLGVIVAYLASHTGEPGTTQIVGVDPVISFLVLTGITRLVHWLGSVAGAPKANRVP